MTLESVTDHSLIKYNMSHNNFPLDYSEVHVKNRLEEKSIRQRIGLLNSYFFVDRNSIQSKRKYDFLTVEKKKYFV